MVVSGALGLPILLAALKNDVVTFELVEDNYTFGTLNALAGVILAKDWRLSWGEGAGSGLDVGDPAVVTNHIFVRLAAVVGDPESGTNATIWWALWHICGDVVGG